MDVYLNEQLLPPAPGAETVDDLLALLRRDEPDRLVVAIRLNGREITGQGLDSLRQTPLNAPGRLDMQSASARSLAATALGQAAETLEQTRRCHTRVAELIAAGKSAKAMDGLNECFAAWNVVEQSLRQSAGLTGIDLDAPAAGDEPPARRIAELRPAITSPSPTSSSTTWPRSPTPGSRCSWASKTPCWPRPSESAASREPVAM